MFSPSSLAADQLTSCELFSCQDTTKIAHIHFESLFPAFYVVIAHNSLTFISFFISYFISLCSPCSFSALFQFSWEVPQKLSLWGLPLYKKRTYQKCYVWNGQCMYTLQQKYIGQTTIAGNGRLGFTSLLQHGILALDILIRIYLQSGGFEELIWSISSKCTKRFLPASPPVYTAGWKVFAQRLN